MIQGEISIKIDPSSVASDVIKGICKEMGSPVITEAQDFALLSYRQIDGHVRPLHPQEYLLDFLLEDDSVHLYLRRVLWRNALFFPTDLYTEVHYQQLLGDYLNGRLLLPPAADTAIFFRQIAELSALQHLAKGQESPPSLSEMSEYVPSQWQLGEKVQEIHSLCLAQIDAMSPLRPQDAKKKVIEFMTHLNLFGINIFLAQKVSHRSCPSPCVVGINQQAVVFIDPKTQGKVFMINLLDIQHMRTTRPKKQGKLGTVHIDYGSSGRTKKLTISVQQAKELCHILALIMEEAVRVPIKSSALNDR